MLGLGEDGGRGGKGGQAGLGDALSCFCTGGLRGGFYTALTWCRVSKEIASIGFTGGYGYAHLLKW